MRQRAVEIVPLIGHLAQRHIRRASGRQRRLAGPCDGIQRLFAGQHDRVQPALGPLNPAQLVAFPRTPGRQPGRPPAGDAFGEGALGSGEPAAKPVGHGQLPLGNGPQYPLAVADLGHAPRSELGSARAVAAELGDIATGERDQGGNVHQQAARRANRGLERIRVRARAGEFRRVDQLLRLFQVAAGRGRDGLRQQQPGTGPDQIGGQRRKPALDRRRFAAQAVGGVKMALDQPRGRGHVAGGDGVPDGLIGQPVLLVPGGRVAVQLRHLAGPFGLQVGAEQVGEQMVVAPPSAHLIQRYQEQPVFLRLLQQCLAAGPAGDRVTQLARQPV
jgi:hypothetical protein